MNSLVEVNLAGEASKSSSPGWSIGVPSVHWLGVPLRTTGGAFGAYMFGVGSTEMLGVVVTGEIWLRVPRTIRMQSWRSAHGPIQATATVGGAPIRSRSR